MRNRVFASLVLLGAVAAAPAGAQCSAGQAQQGCQLGIDLVNFMTPQLATAIAGGSSTLAQSGALGGLGRFALTLRGTGVMNGALPNVSDHPFSTTNASQSYTNKDTPVPGGGVDLSVGLWEGVNLGATHVGGIDAIVSALYLPDVNQGDINIKAKDGNLKLGYGVRIGLLDESLVIPGLYLSYLNRDLPVVSLTGNAGSASGANTATGNFALNDFTVTTSAIRLVAAKNFLIFSLSAGVGQDTYKGSANVTANLTSPVTATSSGSTSFSMTRNNMFLGAAVNLFIFKLAVEAGQVSGGSAPALYNSFAGKSAGDSRSYVSGGLRLAF